MSMRLFNIDGQFAYFPLPLQIILLVLVVSHTDRHLQSKEVLEGFANLGNMWLHMCVVLFSKNVVV